MNGIKFDAWSLLQYKDLGAMAMGDKRCQIKDKRFLYCPMTRSVFILL